MTKVNLLPRLIFWLVALLFAYDAYGHIASIAGMHGYTWADAPVKWRLIDVFYLTLDIIAVVGLLLRWVVGVIAFFVSSVSQVLVFTVLRPWFIDVPENFAGLADGLGYLNLMVGLYVVAIVLILVALRMGAMKRGAYDG